MTQIELALGKRIGKVINRPIDFGDARPYGPQCVAVAEQVGLDEYRMGDVADCRPSAGVCAGGAGLAE
ncbi:MAG: hypothetical protein R3E79_61130 [Caldilineaceae bacterium]